MALVNRDSMPPNGAPPPRTPRSRRWLMVGAALLCVLALTAGGLYLANRSKPAPRPAPLPPPAAQPGRQAAPPAGITALGLPRLAFGFYSAGLERNRCYGSCKPDGDGAANEKRNRQRIAELKRMHVNFVINNVSVKDWYASSPKSFLAFLDDLHDSGIRVSYGLTSHRGVWLQNPKASGEAVGFTTDRAEANFKATDLDGDGVSDLDGRLDVLYLSHEVLEWANHAQRVQMYQLAKRWLPNTPVSVYYAADISRPADPRTRDKPHPRGGTWADFAYGPGEADIVHLSAPPPFSEARRPFSAFEADVELVRRITPNVPIYVSTSFAAFDGKMKNDPSSMWTPEQIETWYRSVREVEGVRGVFLRSYHRFTYDLGHDHFGAQRAAWTRLGSTVSD
jgi:hypothetical protein